jgi:O-acetyl-ADP-ribose deacetylase (regulator of RNase III)
MPINYKTGDATNPQGSGIKVIVHCCNDIGVWGAGFVLALSNKWKQPEKEYRRWYSFGTSAGVTFDLGNVVFIPVEEDISVANLIGQRGVARGLDNRAPIRYKAIEEGFISVADFCLRNNASVHMPRIGCGLAGGFWKEIEPIIEKTLVLKGISVTVYDLK